MTRQIFLGNAIALVIICLSLTPAHAQSTESEALLKTIQDLDARLFNAYNRCDLDTLSSLVAEDLEFYHDQTGLSRGRQAFIEAIKNNICGKVTRELLPGTLEVYPLAHYGAVEIGVHRFHHAHDNDFGDAKFIHLWENKDGKWVVTRVISFDHGGGKK
jgi:hypothetical protein